MWKELKWPKERLIQIVGSTIALLKRRWLPDMGIWLELMEIMKHNGTASAPSKRK